MDNTKNTILICGNFDFSIKNAASKYNLSYALMLRDLGYKVVMVGVREKQSYKIDILTTHNEVDGIIYYSMPYPQNKTDWLKYKQQFNNLLKIIKIYETSLVGFINFSNPSIALWSRQLYKYSKRQKLFIIGHAPENVRFTNKGFIYSIIRGLDDFYYKKVLLIKYNGVIVGGPLLHKFYTNKNVRVICFPTMSDNSFWIDKINNHITTMKGKNGIKKFIYVGIPFELEHKHKPSKFKDRIDKTVELFLQLNKENYKYQFDIYGLTMEEYLRNVPQHRNELMSHTNIIFHGRKPFDYVAMKIIESDYYIFHRDKTRITEAAFPTKGSESISLGTPLITNDTSYIFKYVKDGETGFLINDENELYILKRLIDLSKKEIKEMKEKCLKMNPFSYQTHTEKLKDFLDKGTN